MLMTDFGLMISKCLVAHGMCIQKSYKNDVEHEGGDRISTFIVIYLSGEQA